MWYVHTMEYHSAIKRNTFESVQMRWMILKAIIESEVSKKKKKQILYINTHIYEISTDGTDDPMYRAAKETQI